MTGGLMGGPLGGVIAFLLVVLAITASNLIAMRNLGSYPAPANRPRVSVLIPVRDEGNNIHACLTSLLAQDYAGYEVLVLDDDSHDDTAEIVERLSQDDPRLRLLRGASLPEGWIGKHWACHQLSLQATGDLLLFTDADTRHDRRSLSDAVAALEAEGADLLTAIPRQEVVTWGERLVVPLLPWAIFTLVPVVLAHRWPRLPLSAAIGQFMLFRREAYDRTGGHSAVRCQAVDDLALARRTKAKGFRWRMVIGVDRVTCRMYRGLHEAAAGLSKNLFAVFDCRILPFLFVWLWMVHVFVVPPILAFVAWPAGMLSSETASQALTATVLAWCVWVLAYARLRIPARLGLLAPLTILIAVFLAFRSLGLTLSGSAKWKGRTLVRPEVKWV